MMKILVVDDEKDVQVLFEQRFRKEIKTGETEFAFAFSGEDALVYLEIQYGSIMRMYTLMEWLFLN